MSRHPFDAVSAALGLVFVVLGITLLGWPDFLDDVDAAAVLGVVVAAAGGVVVVSVLARDRRRRERPQDPAGGGS